MMQSAVVPKLLTPALAYFDFLQNVGRSCLYAIAKTLDCCPTYLAGLVQDHPLQKGQHHSYLSIFRYEANSGSADDLHQDLSPLTLVPRSNVSALEFFDKFFEPHRVEESLAGFGLHWRHHLSLFLDHASNSRFALICRQVRNSP